MTERNTLESPILKADTATTKRGMVLPFRPLSLAFDRVNYYISMPAVSSAHSTFILIISSYNAIQHCFSLPYIPTSEKHLFGYPLSPFTLFLLLAL